MSEDVARRGGVRVGLVVDRPACADERSDADVFEVGRDRVEVELVVQRRRRIVGHQEVVAELRDLRARRSLLIRRVAREVHDRAERGQRGVVSRLILVFGGERIALLEVEGLIAVRPHLVHVRDQARPAVAAEPAGVEVDVHQPGVERTVRHGPVQQSLCIQRSRQQAD
jgi:hypothetical protein